MPTPDKYLATASLLLCLTILPQVPLADTKTWLYKNHAKLMEFEL
jgi:hypothetical protein